MSIFFIVLGLVIVLLSVGLVVVRKKAKVVELTTVKIDRAPITKDVEIEVVKNEVKKVVGTSLNYSDPDGDVITHVRYFNTRGSFFYNRGLTNVYIDGTEIDINKELYTKGKISGVKYSVKSNNKWSK